MQLTEKELDLIKMVRGENKKDETKDKIKQAIEDMRDDFRSRARECLSEDLGQDFELDGKDEYEVFDLFIEACEISVNSRYITLLEVVDAVEEIRSLYTKTIRKIRDLKQFL